MALRPYRPVTVRPGSATGLLVASPYARPPGAGTYVRGGNVIDVRGPTLGPPLTRTPVPGTRTVGAPVVPGPVGPAAPPPPPPVAPTAPAADPWQSYLDELDARERAAYDREAALRQARAKDLMESMAGFGKALQGNAAEQWGKVIESYGRAGDTATAYDEALATSYGSGLAAANRQIAQDFAAIGQAGAPAIRDDAAALEQIRTEGGARPGETMGLVGRAWGSYGETRPGSIGFITAQNVSQVARQALQADEDAQVALIRELADNPAEAQSMWLNMQQYKDAQTKAEADAAQQDFENHLKTKQENREQQAYLWTLAQHRTDQTGQLYVVKNGKIVPTNQYAPGSAAGRAATQAVTTRRGQDLSAAAKAASLRAQQKKDAFSEWARTQQLAISQGHLDVATAAESRLQRGAKSKKNKNGYTPKQLQDWRGKGRKALDNVLARVAATKADGYAYDASGKKVGPGLPRLGVTANGEVIPRPRDVVRAALNAGVPYTLIQQMVRNAAQTRFRGNDEWAYAATNW